MAAAMEDNSVGNSSADIENIKSLNQIINLFDPPKDLNVGTYLSQKANGEILKNIIKELFIKKGESLSRNIESQLIGVGDKKTLILERIARKYEKSSISEFSHLDIMREKSPVGSDTKPSKLFLSQDNGPLDVVEQPILILTAGSVLDPAGKTKTGALNLIEAYPNLERNWIMQLSMEPAFANSEIVVSTRKNGGSYFIGINSSVGPIIGKFNTETFVVEESPDAKYFLGNNEKNRDIAKLLKESKGNPSEASKNIIKKYILIKELGDTLQVQWLNNIINRKIQYTNADGVSKELNRTNTVVATTDSVVCFRSLVNKVGVIWTHQGKTTYYLPNIIDKAQEAAIRLSFIDNIRSSLLAHNMGVIQTLVAVKESGEKLTKTDVWIRGLTWRLDSIKVALVLLETTINKLNAMNIDIGNTLRVITDIDAAKQFAARSHFTSPFIYNKKIINYDIIKSTVALIDNKYFPFFANAFTTSNCQALEKAKNMIFGTSSLEEPIRFEVNSRGATGRMRGGDRIKNILEGFYNKTELPPIDSFTQTALENAYNRYMIDSNPTFRAQEDTILQNPDIDSPAFLYCYVRDFHPEIFTFALIQKYAIEEVGEAGIEFLRRNLPNSMYLDATYPIKYLPEGSYSYKDREVYFTSYFEGDDNLFQEYYAVPRREVLDEIFNVTKTAILLANIYFEHFPQVMSPYLRFFMDWFKMKSTREIPGIIRQYGILNTKNEENTNVAMVGGGGELLSEQPFYYEVIENGAAIHSLFFTLKTRAIYEDRFTSNSQIFKEIALEYKNINNIIKNIETRSLPKKILNSLPKQYLPEGIRVGGKTRKVKRTKRRKTRSHK